MLLIGDGRDYNNFTSLILTIGQDTPSLCINVSTIQDQSYELNETFTVSLMSNTDRTIIVGSETLITILDEDEGK